jgi:hypothetical protein
LLLLLLLLTSKLDQGHNAPGMHVNSQASPDRAAAQPNIAATKAFKVFCCCCCCCCTAAVSTDDTHRLPEQASRRGSLPQSSVSGRQATAAAVNKSQPLHHPRLDRDVLVRNTHMQPLAAKMT